MCYTRAIASTGIVRSPRLHWDAIYRNPQKPTEKHVTHLLFQRSIMCYGDHDCYKSRNGLGIHHKDRDLHTGAIAGVQRGIVCMNIT